MEAYGRVSKPFWDDRPVAVVGGGPSLTGFDFEQLRGAHVLALKGSIFDIPWADAGFGLGWARYVEWRDRLAKVQSRIYWAVSDDQTFEPPHGKNITFIRRLDGCEVSDDPGEVYAGGTSGFGALQICIHKRAKQIVLFGFDYDGSYEPTGGKGKHNDLYYLKRMAQAKVNWDRWATHFDAYASYFNRHGISVINACPGSKIRTFQKMTLDDGVAMLHQDRRMRA